METAHIRWYVPVRQQTGTLTTYYLTVSLIGVVFAPLSPKIGWLHGDVSSPCVGFLGRRHFFCLRREKERGDTDTWTAHYRAVPSIGVVFATDRYLRGISRGRRKKREKKREKKRKNLEIWRRSHLTS
ncbi:hypothetical protein BHE74_00046612 [Ensete ventricosum]|nr:hypothetical protein BHE74_00046612 [Ensete ventricosum]